jgi:hypothetical protein
MVYQELPRCTLGGLRTQTSQFHDLNEILPDERYEWGDRISKLPARREIDGYKFLGSML